MATAKKSTAPKKTRAANTKRSQPMRSFVLTKDAPPFFAFRITHQTFYWLLLSGIILALGVWVVALNIKVQMVYDSVDQANSDMDVPAHVSGKSE